METIESFGYPCVLKPVVGSWGRLMAKIDSPSAAEAILEHKATLGHYQHKVFYVQEFVEKPGRDIRVVAVDGDPVAAMTRSSDHWLTNAAKGAEAEAFELDDRARELVQQASDAVGGGLLGVDLMETGVVSESGDSEARQTESDGDYTVHEVNHTVEFKALNDAVETDVPAAVVDWLEAKVEADETVAEATTA
jgi:[lysine-biosynthesis-protein LysW]--L-2-aminoadipate ligase